MISFLRIRYAGWIAFACLLLVPAAVALAQVLEKQLADGAAVPILLVFPAVFASLIGYANSTSVPDSERSGLRPNRLLGLGFLLVATALVVAALIPAVAVRYESWGVKATIRNVIGMVGLAELVAAILGPRLAWAGPLVAGTLTISAAAGSAGRGAWAWLIADDGDIAAMGIAFALFVFGVVVAWFRTPLARVSRIL